MPNESFSVLFKNKIKEFNKITQVDSDKSISIRSFLISSISQGVSEISNVLESEDVFSTINSLKKLNCKIKKIGKKKYKVYGKGLGSYYTKKNTTLNLGNSGTGFRLITSIISTTPNLEVVLTGDSSLKKRSMSKLIALMNEFGAEFFPKYKVHPPFKIKSSEMPIGINYQSGKSAQLKSAVILAGLNSFGNTTVYEKLKTRNHTENILLKNSKSIIFKKNNLFKIVGKKNLSEINIKIPSDPSSAAFFTAICLLNNRSKLKIKNVCLNPRRIGFYNLLKKYGAKIKMINKKKENNEIVGDIIIESSKMRPIKSKPTHYLSATDEFPIMFVIAALTNGISKFYGIAELANKESNRILEMKKILNKIGIKCKSTKDSIIIFGRNKIFKKKSLIRVDCKKDHRIAMSSAVLALNTGMNFSIKGFDTVKTSSPSFLKIVKNLGGKFEIKKKA